MTEEPTPIIEKQNSFIFRYGGTATEIKLYFEDAKDLRMQMLSLKHESKDVREEMTEIRRLLSEDNDGK